MDRHKKKGAGALGRPQKKMAMSPVRLPVQPQPEEGLLLHAEEGQGL